MYICRIAKIAPNVLQPFCKYDRNLETILYLVVNHILVSNVCSLNKILEIYFMIFRTSRVIESSRIFPSWGSRNMLEMWRILPWLHLTMCQIEPIPLITRLIKQQVARALTVWFHIIGRVTSAGTDILYSFRVLQFLGIWYSRKSHRLIHIFQ